MTKLYFIRHGKTEWNQEGRFQGASGDSPLLDEAYDQIKLLGKHLSHVTFTHAFASPIKRAADTARYTIQELDHQPELTFDKGIQEFTMGVWEGKTFSEVEAEWGDMYVAYRHHPESFDASQVQGSETFEQVQRRFKKSVLKAIELYGGPENNLLFFSHGMALTAGMGGLINLPLSELRARGGLGNTSTSILETSDGQHFKELIRNDISYLGIASDESNTV